MKKILIAAALTTAVLFSLPNTHSAAAVSGTNFITDSTSPDTSKMKMKMWKKTKKTKDSTNSMGNGSMTKSDSTKR
jgi:hypothetical protein